jgi:4-amino-4-deoxy-L-arabinose transferase-like glycosyltransferase
MNESRRGALIGGVVLIILGALFLLENLNLIPGGVTDWWPVLVVGAGLWLLAQAVRRRTSGGLVGGILLIGLGGYWLASNLGWVGEGLFLPVLLIALGTGLLLRVLLPDG